MGVHSNDNEFVNAKKAILGGLVGEIDMIVNKKIAPMSAFILLACLIDAAAELYRKPDPQTGNANISDYYKQFVEDYLVPINSLYDGASLWKQFRCKATHAYSEGGKYIFARKGSHLSIEANDLENRRRLVLGQFKKDVINAVRKYFCDVENEPMQQQVTGQIPGPLWNNFLDGYGDRGLLAAYEKPEISNGHIVNIVDSELTCTNSASLNLQLMNTLSASFNAQSSNVA